MPDGNGRFRGISVPRVPWIVDQIDDLESHREAERYHREHGAYPAEAEPPEERFDDGRSDSA